MSNYIYRDVGRLARFIANQGLRGYRTVSRLKNLSSLESTEYWRMALGTTMGIALSFLIIWLAALLMNLLN